MIKLIEIEHQNWDGIPLLICTKKGQKESPLPTVTYLHCITGAKEDYLSIGYLLAEQGFRVILPDAHLHGERESEESNNLELHFFEIIEKSIADIALIYEKLNQDRLVKNGSFALAGTSLGGITTAVALTIYPWISHAGMMMGTALYHRFSSTVIKQAEEHGVELPLSKQEITDLLTNLKRYDLSLNLDRLENRPLFIWHGEKDEIVPYQHAVDFYQQVKERSPNSDFVTFITDKHAGHKVNRRARLALVDWMTKMSH